MNPKAAPPLRIAIFASGNGSNALRLMEHFAASPIARITCVATNNPRAGVLEKAEKHGVPHLVLSKNMYGSGRELCAWLAAREIDMIVLAGYLKHVPDEVIAAYPKRIVNIHPSLLPAYGGKGMYGMRVHEAVLAAGESESGITIHYVNEVYDTGEVILQEKVEIDGNWEASDLAKAIHQLEHANFPKVVAQIAGELHAKGNTEFNNIHTELSMKKIGSALISVYHKDGLDRIAQQLDALGVRIYSTGGTASYVRNLGIEVHEVADMTAYPSILGGRVKTLHPKVFGGILARRADASDMATMEEYEIPALDLVIVDLYPFEDTVASGAPEADIIEKIDIGGISLIRAAAKNFKDVLCLPSMEHYDEFYDMLVAQEGAFSLEQRKYFAAEAFDISSHYDVQIYQHMAGTPRSFKVSHRKSQSLRYGENPHQEATFYGDLAAQFDQLNGKPLSYNNLLDVDAAVNLMTEFKQAAPCFAVFKHTNPCGVAIGTSMLDAWQKALACDPVSAFGGILICNGKVEADVAEAIREIFFEVLIAEEFSDEAVAILSKRKKRILLKRKSHDIPANSLRTAVNGILFQEKDNLCGDKAVYEPKTSRQANDSALDDISFGEKVGKHLKSNAIAIVKDRQLIGSGIGQTSRVDALKQAISKAREKGFDLKGSILYSDAFFPFSDCAELSREAGIEILAEPGGSMRDQDTIDYCETHDMCLIFTKYRHFKH